jgi:thiamine-monophosphate kinase
MIDLSDGLAGDLGHIVEESRCGAVLRKEAIPISSAAKASADGRSPLEHAMTDGEDFELCLTAPEADARRMLDEQPLGDVALTAVGRIVAEMGLWWELPGGGSEPITLKGYEHRLD